MQYDVKELNLGGILDQAIALTRNHIGLCLGVASLSLGYSLVTGLIQVATMPPLSPTATFQEQIAAMNEANVQLIRWLPLFLLAALAVASLTNAALVVAITKKYLGEPVTAGESLKQALGRFFPLIWTWILLFFASLGGLMLFIIPFFIVLIWFSLATQVVVLERASGFAALGRSYGLVKGNFLTVLALFFIIGSISSSLNLASLVIPEPYLRTIIAALVQTVMTIVSSASMVVFYYSCRSKHENFDLFHLAQTVSAQPPDAVSPKDEFEDV